MGHDMRRHLHDATLGRGAAPRPREAGFRAFFGFVATRPDLYRIVRSCQFFAPGEYPSGTSGLAERNSPACSMARPTGRSPDVDLSPPPTA